MRLLSMVCFLIAATAVLAQDKPASQTDEKPVVAPVKSATVPVVVRDRKGGVVDGLATPNFSVKVDGTVQPVVGVARGAASPVTVGVLFDVGSGQRNAIENERKAARTMLGLLRPGDQMFVVQFAQQIELLQGPTDVKSKLEKALAEVGTSSANFTALQPATSQVDNEGRKVRSGGTSLYDAMFLASEEVLGKEQNKRALVVMSDGVDVGSKESLGDMMESVERNGVMVYTMFSRNVDAGTEKKKEAGHSTGNGNGRPTVGYPGSYPGGGYPGGYPQGGGTGQGGGNKPTTPGTTPEKKPDIDGVQVLKTMSDKTGGRMFDGGKKTSLDDDFAVMEDDLRAVYWVTFTEAGTGARHGYHPFDLLVAGDDKSKKVEIQTSDGFVGGN